MKSIAVELQSIHLFRYRLSVCLHLNAIVNCECTTFLICTLHMITFNPVLTGSIRSLFMSFRLVLLLFWWNDDNLYFFTIFFHGSISLALWIYLRDSDSIKNRNRRQRKIQFEEQKKNASKCVLWWNPDHWAHGQWDFFNISILVRHSKNLIQLRPRFVYKFERVESVWRLHYSLRCRWQYFSFHFDSFLSFFVALFIFA